MSGKVKKDKKDMKLCAFWIPKDLSESFSKYAKERATPMSHIVSTLLSDLLAQTANKAAAAVTTAP